MKATVSGITHTAAASAVHRVVPLPRTTASPHSQAISASISTPVTMAMGER